MPIRIKENTRRTLLRGSRKDQERPGKTRKDQERPGKTRMTGGTAMYPVGSTQFDINVKHIMEVVELDPTRENYNKVAQILVDNQGGIKKSRIEVERLMELR